MLCQLPLHALPMHIICVTGKVNLCEASNEICYNELDLLCYSKR